MNLDQKMKCWLHFQTSRHSWNSNRGNLFLQQLYTWEWMMLDKLSRSFCSPIIPSLPLCFRNNLTKILMIKYLRPCSIKLSFLNRCLLQTAYWNRSRILVLKKFWKPRSMSIVSQMAKSTQLDSKLYLLTPRTEWTSQSQIVLSLKMFPKQ